MGTHLNTTMNDDCCSLFGCHLVVFECGQLFSCMGGHFHLWVLVFVCWWLFLFVGACLHMWALIFVCGHAVIVCHLSGIAL